MFFSASARIESNFSSWKVQSVVDNRVYGKPRKLTIVVVALAVDILRSFGVGGFVVFFGIWTVLA